MPIIVTDNNENEEVLRFRTYLNYLLALDVFLKNQFHNNPVPFKNVVQSKSFKKIQSSRCADLNLACKTMRSAWLSEIQLSIPVLHPELVAYANHWAPVQLYYCIYLAIRAFFHSAGKNIPEHHSATLRAITNEIISRPDLFPSPWRVICSGDPKLTTIKYNNLPARVSIFPVSCLTHGNNVPFWDSFGLSLKTTRTRQIEKSIKEWKKQNKRKRIKRNERKEVENKMGPTSIFHFFYRLRTRSNYDDAEAFLVSLGQGHEAKLFHSALRNTAWYTLLVLELLISQYVGKETFSCWVDNFQSDDLHNLAENLIVRRRKEIKSFFS
jgi:hypothetical protein